MVYSKSLFTSNRRNKKDFFPTERWNILETTGHPLMLNPALVNMTTGQDVVFYTVPKGERWVIFNTYMVNSSGQTIVCVSEIVDSANVSLKTLSYGAAITNGATLESALTAPYVVYGGQKIRFAFGALAGKTGTSKAYVNALQFQVGKGD